MATNNTPDEQMQAAMDKARARESEPRLSAAWWRKANAKQRQLLDELSQPARDERANQATAEPPAAQGDGSGDRSPPGSSDRAEVGSEPDPQKPRLVLRVTLQVELFEQVARREGGQ